MKRGDIVSDVGYPERSVGIISAVVDRIALVEVFDPIQSYTLHRHLDHLQLAKKGDLDEMVLRASRLMCGLEEFISKMEFLLEEVSE